MPEEMKLEVSIPEMKEGILFDLSKASEKDAAYSAAYCSQKICGLAFRYSGINLQILDRELSKYAGKGPKEAGTALLAAKSLREAMKDGAGKLTLVPACESYFFAKFAERFGFSAKLLPSMLPSTLKPKTFAPGPRIALAAKYKQWIAIKKLSIEEGVEGWEYAGILAGINETLVKKAFDFAGLDQEELNAKAAQLTKGKRKSYQSIAEAIQGIEGPPAETAYLYNSILSTFAVLPYSNRAMLSKEYSEIKGPRMRGRKPKG